MNQQDLLPLWHASGQAPAAPSPTRSADTVIVLDFETTGLSPAQGDRAIEIGAVKLEGGRITGRFQELMNPGRPISRFIENYTGISNAMLAPARPCEAVMADFAEFIAGHPLVAHNASFDQRFLEAELRRVGHRLETEMGCSLLLARRVYPEAPSHRLANLVSAKSLPSQGVFHRALADAEMTAWLWLKLLEDIRQRAVRQHLGFDSVLELMRLPKAQVPRWYSRAR